MTKVAIIDYGVGNLLSLKRAFEHIKINSVTTDNPSIIEKCTHLILPGVGSFSPAMKLLKKKKLDIEIKKFVKNKKPVLGICLGMQLLFDESEEFGIWKGLSVIPGKVKKINKKNIHVPIIGWYKLQLINNNNFLKNYDNKYFYLVHSYECKPKNRKHIIAGYNMGKNKIVSAIKYKNIFGLQFHPEKSSLTGLKLLKDFSKI